MRLPSTRHRLTCVSQQHQRRCISSQAILGVSLLLSLLFAVILPIVVPSLSHAALAASADRSPRLQEANFTLDGVTVTVRSPFLPAKTFSVSPAGAKTQIANATSADHPYGAIYITAVPFGTKPQSEGVPIAQVGGASAYRASLHQFRVQEGDRPQPGPTVTIFGQHIRGEASLLGIAAPNQHVSSMLVVEWVAEAGSRLWLVRISQERPQSIADLTAAAPFLTDLRFLTLASTTLTHPSTVTAGRAAAVQPLTASSAIDSLPTWWNGYQCDSQHYNSAAGGTWQAHPLGTVAYHALVPCGPRPATNLDNAPDIGENIGGVSVWEWECVELSLRYLYLGYGIIPYHGNGNQIVHDYTGSALTKLPYDQDPRYAPTGSNPLTVPISQLPQPGDVLSLMNIYSGSPAYATGDAGHTGLVNTTSYSGSSWSFTYMEQNGAKSGYETIHVTVNGGNATIQDEVISSSWSQRIIGWLHDSSSGSPPPSDPSAPAASSTSTCTPVNGPHLSANCDAPSPPAITCGGAIGSRNDYSGIPINWTYTNGSTPCVTITYSFGFASGRTTCSFYFYAPNGFATTTIQATLSDGSHQSFYENPVSGWQHWFDATGITSLTFTDGNGTTNQQMGWGSSSGQSIERICSL